MSRFFYKRIGDSSVFSFITFRDVSPVGKKGQNRTVPNCTFGLHAVGGGEAEAFHAVFRNAEGELKKCNVALL